MTTTTTVVTLASLRRLRWAVRATLALGVAVSVTANVLHAEQNPIAQAIAAWPPLALLITVDLVSRVPIHRRALGAIRIAATFTIATIAAYVSYGHMAGVAARYGESGLVPYLLPLSVDGLVACCAVSLVELTGRLRTTATAAAEPTTMTNTTSPVASPPVQAGAGMTVSAAQSGLPPTVPMGDDTVDRTSPPGDAAAAAANDPVPDVADSGDDAHDEHHLQPPEPDQVTQRPFPTPPGLAGDLVPLLDAARRARDDLLGEGHAVTRDALAARLRADGHAIRTRRVAELLAALKTESTPTNGRRPT